MNLKSLMIREMARSSLSSTEESINVELSPQDSISRSRTSKRLLVRSCLQDSSDLLSCLPITVSWITSKPERDTWEEELSDSSTKWL